MTKLNENIKLKCRECGFSVEYTIIDGHVDAGTTVMVLYSHVMSAGHCPSCAIIGATEKTVDV